MSDATSPAPAAPARVVDFAREGLVLGGLKQGLDPWTALDNAGFWMAWIEAAADDAERSAREGFALAAIENYGTARFDGGYALGLEKCAAFVVVTAPAA